MKELAHAVHGIVTGEETSASPDLSRLEQEALKDLGHLINFSPRDLSDWLVHQHEPEEWWRASTPSSTPAHL